MSAVAQHTPGPWILRGNYVCVDDAKRGEIIIAVVRHARGAGDANHHLITTAPELLEFAESVRDNPDSTVSQVRAAAAVIAAATKSSTLGSPK